MNKDTLIHLRELMQRAGTPGEAEAAAAAYQRGLTKLNLTEADLQDAWVSSWVRLGDDDADAVWKASLLSVCADKNYVLVAMSEHNNIVLVFGPQSRVARLQTFYLLALGTFSRLAVGAHVPSFMFGAIAGLQARFAEVSPPELELESGMKQELAHEAAKQGLEYAIEATPARHHTASYLRGWQQGTAYSVHPEIG